MLRNTYAICFRQPYSHIMCSHVDIFYQTVHIKLSDKFINCSLTHSVLILFYRQATGAISFIPSFTLSYLYKTPFFVPILSVNWVYQLSGYKISPMKWSNTGNVQKIDVLMYLNARRLQATLGIQSMFLPTPIVGASIEWVKVDRRPMQCEK